MANAWGHEEINVLIACYARGTNGIGGDSGAGARENRGREEAEERAGSGSSKKAGIIY